MSYWFPAGLISVILNPCTPGLAISICLAISPVSSVVVWIVSNNPFVETISNSAPSSPDPSEVSFLTVKSYLTGSNINTWTLLISPELSAHTPQYPDSRVASSPVISTSLSK